MQEELRTEYPEFAQEDQVGFLVGPQGPVPAPSTRHWRLSTPDSAWTVVLAPEFVTLEASAPGYSDYDEFRDRFARVWDAAVRHLRPARRAQQGLRYVNHIEKDVPATGWQELINTELLGSFAIDVFGEELDQAICDLRVNTTIGTLAVKHGFLRAGPRQAKGYLLDFDYFNPGVSPDMTVETVMLTFNEYHNVIYPLFRWCVTDRALEAFRFERGTA